MRLTLPNWLFLPLFILFIGCGEQAEIESYQTAKEDDVYEKNHVEGTERPERTAPPMPAARQQQPAAEAEEARMFAAIVPEGEQNWFYKVTGPIDAVGEKAEELAKFITSVEYENGEPKWTLPEGWEQQPGNSFRFATLMIPAGEQKLEMSVSPLPSSGQETTEVVANVNRWRGQLGLGEIQSEVVESASSSIDDELSKQKQDDRTIYFVNIVGKQQPSRMPPFAR